MTPDRWTEIKQLIEDTFEIVDSYDEDLDPGTAECIEFVAPQGTLKAVFHSKPKVLDKKTNYSRRVGSDVQVNYVYSENEVSTFVKFFLWNDDKQLWVELSGDSIF